VWRGSHDDAFLVVGFSSVGVRLMRDPQGKRMGGLPGPHCVSIASHKFGEHRAMLSTAGNFESPKPGARERNGCQVPSARSAHIQPIALKILSEKSGILHTRMPPLPAA